MRNRWILGLVLIAGMTPLSLAGRFDDLTKKFESTPDQAKVVAASYLGSAGTEWLVGGGFQPDGTVVVAGVTLGPKLDLGKAETVLGKDNPAPPAFEPKTVTEKGKTRTLAPNWRESQATAFVARLSADLKEVKSVARLPWGAAGLTGAVTDANGAIYLTGPATPQIMKLPGDNQSLKSSVPSNDKAACQLTYVAKLSPTGDAIQWIRHISGPSGAPDIEIDKQGNIRFQGPDLRTFSPTGQELSVVIIPGGISGRTAIHPFDGTFARGGERRNWHTGREPYRDPVLNIYKPDGKLKYELYHWDGPLVGLDNLRLVSDSVVRILRYDDDGNLILYAWSDGGNSVMYREPYDIRTMAKNFKGLGMSAWGAGVLSCAYIIKLDSRSYQVTGGTLWLAFLRDKDKPNSINLDTLSFASDGSVCIAGSSAWGLIQTGNAIGGCDPAGTYVSILSADCSSLRFSSAMPACGKCDLNEGTRWGVVRGTRNGKPAVLYLCGAGGPEEIYGKTLGAPAVNARQSQFAGGAADGYMLLLDLGK